MPNPSRPSVLVVTRRPDVVQGLRNLGVPFACDVTSPDHLDPSDIARKYPVVVFDRVEPETVSRVGAQLRELDDRLEFVAVVGTDRERDGVDSLHAGAHDFVVWKSDSDASPLATIVAHLLNKAGAIPSQAPPAEGTFGNYELYRRLAVGGMAEVYLARRRNPRDDTPVVIKRMRPELASNPEFQSMFLDEARISSQLDHPNIVSVLDYGEAEGHFFITLQYVPGCNLAHLGRLLNWKLPPPVAAYIVAEICDALRYAHDAVDNEGKPLNIVHRDVGPPNVLISLDGRIMLADFGIAKAQQRKTETVVGVIKGRAEYMSPEQVAGYPLDRRSDLFSTGVVLYQLLAGFHPFRGASHEDTFLHIRTVNPKPPSTMADVDPELDRIVMEALAKDPDDRYPDAEALGEDLRDWLRERPQPVGADAVRALLEEAFGGAGATGSWDEAEGSIDEDSYAGTITGIPGIIPSQEWLAATPVPSSTFGEITNLGPEELGERTPVSAFARPAAAESIHVGPVPAHSPDPTPSQSTGPRAEAPTDDRPSRESGNRIVLSSPTPREPMRKPELSSARPVFPGSANPPARSGLLGWAVGALLAVVALVVIGVLAFPPRSQRGPGDVARVSPSAQTTPQPTPTRVRTPATSQPTPVKTAIPVKTATPAATPQPTPRRVATPRRTRKPTPRPTPRGVGTLSIWVDTWATVSIDGKPQQATAPVIGLKVSAGRHRITLENTSLGVKRDIDVVIRRGQETKLNVKLSK